MNWLAIYGLITYLNHKAKINDIEQGNIFIDKAMFLLKELFNVPWFENMEIEAGLTGPVCSDIRIAKAFIDCQCECAKDKAIEKLNLQDKIAVENLIKLVKQANEQGIDIDVLATVHYLMRYWETNDPVKIKEHLISWKPYYKEIDVQKVMRLLNEVSG